MSNSPLVTYTNLTKHYSTRKSPIDAVIVHCVVGQWTAKTGCDYFATTTRECSANYVVGKDGSIGLSVEEKNRAWTSGGSYTVNGITGAAWDHRAVTIEVASDTAEPYAITDAAYEATIKLLADICQRNGIKKLLWKNDKSLVGDITKQNIALHSWFANKSCPGTYIINKLPDMVLAVNQLLGAEPAVLYRVQVGAYKLKTNAEKQLAAVKAAGFTDAFITTAEAKVTPAKPALKPIDEVAKEVINGRWGNGATRKAKLTEAGYDYSVVQARVNELLRK